MKTLTAEKKSANPQTNTICSPQTSGIQSHWRLIVSPEIRATEINRAICTNRCTQLDRTLVMGTTSRGTGTRLIRPALSTMEVVPVIHATVKKLNGTMPHRANTAKCGMFGLGKILVKTTVNTPTMTSGLISDQKTPSDMFRYRIWKCFSTRFSTKDRD